MVRLISQETIQLNKSDGICQCAFNVIHIYIYIHLYQPCLTFLKTSNETLTNSISFLLQIT